MPQPAPEGRKTTQLEMRRQGAVRDRAAPPLDSRATAPRTMLSSSVRGGVTASGSLPLAATRCRQNRPRSLPVLPDWTGTRGAQNRRRFLLLRRSPHVPPDRIHRLHHRSSSRYPATPRDSGPPGGRRLPVTVLLAQAFRHRGRRGYVRDVGPYDLPGRSPRLLRPFLDRHRPKRSQPLTAGTEGGSRIPRHPHRSARDSYFRQVSATLGGHSSGTPQSGVWPLSHQPLQDLARRSRRQHDLLWQLCPAESHERTRRSSPHRLPRRSLLFHRDHSSDVAQGRSRTPSPSLRRRHADRVGSDVPPPS
jgi:hypothetical protein